MSKIDDYLSLFKKDDLSKTYYQKSLDLFKYYLNKGDSNKAENALDKNYGFVGAGDLALLKISLGKKEEAKKLVEAVLKLQEDKYSLFYDDKIYLALVKLEKDKIESAKKFIMINSDNPQKTWNTISKEFKEGSKDLKELENFKNNYDYLYNYFDSNYRDSLKGRRNIIKTSFLLDLATKDNNIDKNKLVDFYKILM